MNSFEKLILAVLFIVAAVAIIVVVSHDAKAKAGAFAQSKDVYPVTAARMASKTVDFRGDIIDSDKVIDRETEAPKTAVYQDLTAESDGTDGLEVVYEQTASEEETSASPGRTETGCDDDAEQVAQGHEEIKTIVSRENESETVHEPTEVESEKPMETEVQVHVPRYYSYTIAGVECPAEIGDFLVAELDKYGITDQWINIALAQMFQESHFNPYAENRNGLDKGILQYRVTYWDWSRGDIFDWRAQIRLYCEQTARRLASGCSIWETVSRHNTSDYGTYNQEYVDQVFQWLAPEC